ncbi:MAG: Deoxycytidine deaminase [Parcubacteria group bacterium GW2011_GWA1_49_26]|nr:MAG: Deoxycytidine deaminase [Parcubacteria group bacterium GW2011_GWA1_49_26]
MVLGIAELQRLVKEKNLVENLSERELKNPEGAGFDLRIGELYEVSGKGFLGIAERETPTMDLIAKYEDGKKHIVVLKPQKYYVMKTVEDVNMPENILAIMTPRSYKGGLNMGICNFRDEDFELEMGARVVHIMFFEVKGEGNLYRGQWQGGRVTTDQRETQV